MCRAQFVMSDKALVGVFTMERFFFCVVRSFDARIHPHLLRLDQVLPMFFRDIDGLPQTHSPVEAYDAEEVETVSEELFVESSREKKISPEEEDDAKDVPELLLLLLLPLLPLRLRLPLPLRAFLLPSTGLYELFLREELVLLLSRLFPSIALLEFAAAVRAQADSPVTQLLLHTKVLRE